ncbi:ICP55 [[Candida] subhashii]|uniref:ICP55 n=1 Tax=[Candida] subhashii TaxID=561895 RepID=A0A8J5QGF7_9ASCO|nr:ICP55 [[Candida] subhashii]KAG7664116.1 ICP55 [[Candida] subhashii]
MLTPGISALEYFNRRLELSKKLPAKSLAILIGNSVQYSSGSVFYDFQQDNDLYYLTGWNEPDTIAIIEKKSDNGDENDVVFHMLVPPKNELKELWEGAKSGLEGAYDVFNADMVEDIARAPIYIKKLIMGCESIYWDQKFGSPKEQDTIKSFFHILGNSNSVNDIIRKSRKPLSPLSDLIAELRCVKSPAEIKVMHFAGQISARAINKAMGKVGSENPILTEKTLAKYLDYQFVKGGCDKQAYIPVVASGRNALTIHYTRNDDLLYQDEMVFVDAGGKLGGYCADISRTWPNSPKGFSDAQRDIYEAVLNTNKKCIELCDESLGYSMHDIHETSLKSLKQELNNLPGFDVTLGEVSRYLYPHYIGHHLGLDLHDIPTISRFRKLEDGNVITIEPGVYIPEDDKWPKHFQGIGVRVEDDIVVGKSNDEIINLTSGCVKEIADIESLISSGGCTTPGINDELVVLDI